MFSESVVNMVCTCVCVSGAWLGRVFPRCCASLPPQDDDGGDGVDRVRAAHDSNGPQILRDGIWSWRAYQTKDETEKKKMKIEIKKKRGGQFGRVRVNLSASETPQLRILGI